MTTPEFNQNQHIWEIDVPGDNSCLFWAVALAYLIPVKDDDHIFQSRFKKLFSKASLWKLEQVKNLIKSYNPFSVDAVYQDDTLGKLVREQFRYQVVGHIGNPRNRDRFTPYVDDTKGDFNSYLSNMEDINTWGGELEIRAMSELLDLRIQVTTAWGAQNYGSGIPLQLFHVKALPNSPGEANHYHFGLEKSLGDTYRMTGMPEAGPKTDERLVTSSSQSVSNTNRAVVEVSQQRQPNAEKEVSQPQEKRIDVTMSVVAVSGTESVLNAGQIEVTGIKTTSVKKVVLQEGSVMIVKKPGIQQATLEQPIWFDMRAPVKSFTGRKKELKILYEALQKSKGEQVVVSQMTSISGLGGMGKSELARKYAYDLRKDYDNNAVWINAETQESLRKSFQRLAKELKISTTERKDEKEQEKDIKSVVKDIYKYFQQVKSLFILDNVEEYKDIHEFLPSSLSPDDKKPYVLITSRNRDWEVGEEGSIEVVPLNEFTPEEAIEFLKKSLSISNLPNEEVKKLTEELQYFPLALGQAIAYIKENNMTIGNYLKEYEKEAKELLGFESKYKSDRYTKTTFITWQITLVNIEHKEHGKQALKILAITAYLSPDNIRTEMFLALVNGHQEKLEYTVQLIKQYSMINLEQGVFSIHRLVQQVIRLELQKPGKKHSLVQQVVRLGLRNQNKEEKVLRKALELINGSDEKYLDHAISVWDYASKYGQLIDDFYFKSIYGGYQEYTPLHVLAKNGHYKAIEGILTYIEKNRRGKLSKVVHAKNTYGITPLREAAQSGHLEVVKYLIEKGADIKNTDKLGYTPLQGATQDGQWEVAKYLIEKGADFKTIDKHGWTPIRDAVQEGKLELVRYLIEKGADLNIPNKDGWTLLHSAAESGSLDLVKYLIDKDAGLNIPNKDGWTPLHSAAKSGNLDLVKYLIDKDADFNSPDKKGWTSLHSAAQYGQWEVVKYLIENGADLNISDKDGWTLLHGAIQSGQLEIVKYLIEKGVDLNIPDKNGRTPLHSAVGSGSLDLVKYLIKKGADLNIPDKNGRTPLQGAAGSGILDLVKYLIEKGADLNIPDKDGRTSLYLAVFNGQLEVVRHLIEKGADFKATDKLSWTPLHWAASKGQLEVINYLIEKDADFKVFSRSGRTPLHLAAKEGKLDVVNYLIEKGADFKAPDKDDMTPLHSASAGGHLEVVKILIEKGADFKSPSKDYMTPLYLAAKEGKLDVVNYLIEKGVDFKAPDKDDMTPLHSASAAGHLEVVKILIEKGTDFNAMSNHWLYSGTPLHGAANNGQLEVVRYLIEKGADVHARNSEGRTPLYLARQYNRHEVVQLLSSNLSQIQSYQQQQKAFLHLAQFVFNRLFTFHK